MPHAPVVTAFRALHAAGCFVLPNPWDAGSARFLHHLGFSALASTSAGAAFSRGLPDAIDAMPRDVVLAHLRELVGATPLPVNADFQHGYAADPDGVAQNVTLCVGTGVAGLSIEDASGHPASPLFERALAIDRIRAARAAIDATGSGVVLTARCEAFLVRSPDAEAIVLDRLVAYADAGADCLFAPRVPDELIARVVAAVAPKPLNVVVTTDGPTVAQLATLGVRRISVGSSLARVAWGAFMRASRELADAGTFGGFAGAASFAELEALFAGPRT